jgi:hypothetical protein
MLQQKLLKELFVQVSLIEYADCVELDAGFSNAKVITDDAKIHFLNAVFEKVSSAPDVRRIMCNDNDSVFLNYIELTLIKLSLSAGDKDALLKIDREYAHNVFAFSQKELIVLYRKKLKNRGC